MNNKATSLFIVLRKFGSFLRLPHLCLPFLPNSSLRSSTPFSLLALYQLLSINNLEALHILRVILSLDKADGANIAKSCAIPWDKRQPMNAHCCTRQVMCSIEQGKAEGSGEAIISGVFLERKRGVTLALYWALWDNRNAALLLCVWVSSVVVYEGDL